MLAQVQYEVGTSSNACQSNQLLMPRMSAHSLDSRTSPSKPVSGSSRTAASLPTRNLEESLAQFYKNVNGAMSTGKT